MIHSLQRNEELLEREILELKEEILSFKSPEDDLFDAEYNVPLSSQ